jgi:hypothetical protein
MILLILHVIAVPLNAYHAKYHLRTVTNAGETVRIKFAIVLQVLSKMELVNYVLFALFNVPSV